jgi:hypothetical protein
VICAIICAFGFVKPAQAAVIEAGSYEEGVSSGAGTVTLGPGTYRFEFSFSGPVLYLNEGPEKQTVTNFFCVDPSAGPDEFNCGGDEVPTQPQFEQISPTIWTAYLTVNLPTEEIFPPGDFVVRETTFDSCCTYTYDFKAERSGHYVFSYNQVPEPSCWALMIGGFALIGVGVRRRRKLASPAPEFGGVCPGSG